MCQQVVKGTERLGRLGTRKKLTAQIAAALAPFLRILRARRRECSFLYYTIATTRSGSILSYPNDEDGKPVHRVWAGVRLRAHARVVLRER